MRTYELNYLISPNLSENEIKDFQEKIVSLIQKGGILIDSRLPKRIILAYPIKKNNSAFFTTLNFQMKAENLAAFEKELKSETNAIKHLILTKTPQKAVESRKKPLIVSVSRKTEEQKEKKVEIEKIEEKLEEVLGDNQKI